MANDVEETARAQRRAQQPQVVYEVEVDQITKNILVYVAGYLVHTNNMVCVTCRNVLLKHSKVAAADAEYLALLKSYTAFTEGEVGNIHLPTELFQELENSVTLSSNAYCTPPMG